MGGGVNKSIKEMLEEAKDEKLLSWAENPNIYKNGDFEMTNNGKWPGADGRTYHHLHVTTLKHPATTSVAKLVLACGGKPALLAIVLVEHGAKPSAAELRTMFEESFNGTSNPNKMVILKM